MSATSPSKPEASSSAASPDQASATDAVFSVDASSLRLPEDPCRWYAVSRWSPARLLYWTARRRYHELTARLQFRSLASEFERCGAHVEPARGDRLSDSAVTSNQLGLLLRAVASAATFPLPMVEIGSFRGVTTAAIATASQRPVVAVDPFAGEGGHEKDLSIFKSRTNPFANITHRRQTSAAAFRDFGANPVSLVFIDAIHEYLHAWHDFESWGQLVVPGGFVAFHDVDDFPGVNKACWRLITQGHGYKPWAYAPNMAIFQKEQASS